MACLQDVFVTQASIPTISKLGYVVGGARAQFDSLKSETRADLHGMSSISLPSSKRYWIASVPSMGVAIHVLLTALSPGADFCEDLRHFDGMSSAEMSAVVDLVATPLLLDVDDVDARVCLLGIFSRFDIVTAVGGKQVPGALPIYENFRRLAES